MKRIIITLIVALLSFSAIATNKKVAVFDPAGNAGNAVREIVREKISSSIVNIGGYEVVERHLIEKLLEEHKMQLSGLIDDNQVVEMGKLMGANVAIVTSVTEMGSNYFISIKMIDVQTAQIEKQNTGQSQRGLDDLISVVETVLGGVIGAPQSNEPATIYFYRPRKLLGLGSYDVFFDGEVIGQSKNNWRTSKTIRSFGTKRVSATIEGRSSDVEIRIVPGGVYYVRCSIDSRTVETGKMITTQTKTKTGYIKTDSRPETRTEYTPILQVVDRSVGASEYGAINN